jgi:hypothetical protein
MQTGAITDWGQAMMTSVAAGLALFMAALPKVLGAIVILIIGWFVAGLLAKAVAAILRRVDFNALADRSGFSSFVRQMNVDTDASGMIGLTAKWFVRLITLVVAFDALGLPAVSQVLQRLLLWLPNVVVALVILVIGGLAARALASLVRGAAAQAGLGNPDLLATIARVTVWGFAIVVAVNQIGVASTLVNTLFMAFVGAMALAAGLAFGLGGRDTAAQIVRNWYERTRAAAPRIEQAAAITQREARTDVRERPAA